MTLMYNLQLKKFRQNPELIDEVNERGGLSFIYNSEHTVGTKNSRWEGKGLNSNFIKVLAKSYETVSKELNKFIPVKTIMLARNSEFKGKSLKEETKQQILQAYNQDAEFVVGDMPNVDSQFIDYLQEIGAKFTIYHTGDSPRIIIDERVSLQYLEYSKLSKEKQQPIMSNEEWNSKSEVLRKAIIEALKC